jgi:uncharacterized membrane protein
MTLFHAVLIAATLLCSLVAGFLFAFASVVMPGIRTLDDGAFLRAFQVIDGVIQRGQRLFLLVWVGSVVTLLVAATSGIWLLRGGDRLTLIAAALIYVACVQLPTATINIPMNNTLQRVDVAMMGEAVRRETRQAFEPRWNRWNAIRTVCATVVSIVLLVILLRI